MKEYCVFSDESYTTAERYRSIAGVSFPRKYQKEITHRLIEILIQSGAEEFKWEKLKNAKYRFCAYHILDFLFEELFRKDLRVDIIIWDTYDSRHKIPGRDDDANFGRMFFHLMKSLMKRREKGSLWYVYPDENLAIDWDTIQDCLRAVGKWREYFADRLFGDAFSEQFFRIRQFEQVSSQKSPCCNIADLFAGMSVFSKNHYDKFKIWCSENSPQACLFDSPKEIRFSNKERERFKVLNLFVKRCRDGALGVSIDTFECLCTRNPNYPINFWHYSPQHPDDKAPTRPSS